jgi:HAD superfamily hydrolase (TIGR01509 family)
MSKMFTKHDASAIHKFVDSKNITAIISDLDGVLIETDHDMEKYLSAKEKLTMVKFVFKHVGKRPTKEWLFEKLDLISQSLPEMNPSHQAFNEGLRMPQIMCEWQVGLRTSDESKKLAWELISKAQTQKKLSKNDGQVLSVVCDLMFDVDRFTASRKLTNGSLNFVQSARAQLFLLSNFAQDQFAECKKKFPSLFDCFLEENIILSTQVGLVKPDPSIFRMVLAKGCDPESTLYVDDEIKNVDGAFEAGIKYAYVPGKGIFVNEQ